MIKTVADLKLVLDNLDPNMPLHRPIKRITVHMSHIGPDGYNWGDCFGYDRDSKSYGCCEAMRQRKLSDNPIPTLYIER